jgi:DNA processing protein
MDLEPLYLYIASRLPSKYRPFLQSWAKAGKTFEELCMAGKSRLAELGVEGRDLESWESQKDSISVTAVFDSMAESQIEAIPFYDKRYPELLSQLSDKPAVLFCRGKITDANEACLAIVGSRLMSTYGRSVIGRITDPLIDSGCSIVSGLAYGIDAAAHAEAVGKNSRTIAVLGSGLDDESIYPRMHAILAKRIMECGGLLVSEYPPGTGALRHHFVARNRIIAGMTLGTCVVECKAKSGALITAEFAMDYNRSVYAVPGPINSILSEGPNGLIKQGAIPVTSGEDILNDLGIAVTSGRKAEPELTHLQRRVLECMKSGPASMDEIGEHTKIGLAEILSAISFLELHGLITNAGNQKFIKI